jgi:hypothetical protein
VVCGVGKRERSPRATANRARLEIFSTIGFII